MIPYRHSVKDKKIDLRHSITSQNDSVIHYFAQLNVIGARLKRGRIYQRRNPRV